jgi:hypothetical protein
MEFHDSGRYVGVFSKISGRFAISYQPQNLSLPGSKLAKSVLLQAGTIFV